MVRVKILRKVQVLRSVDSGDLCFVDCVAVERSGELEFIIIVW